MEQLSQQQSSELNNSLRYIQDAFDDAVSETGSPTKAVKIIRDKFLNIENSMIYKIHETKRLLVYVTALNIYDGDFSVNLGFESKFSMPSFKKGEVSFEKAKYIALFSNKREAWEWHNFGDKYYQNVSFQDVREEKRVKLNQIDIESMINERDEIASDYADFIKNGYSINPSGALVYKDFAINYFVWGKKIESYIPDIYKHILADFREGNECDRRFVINKEDKEIIITFEENNGKISINFQNTTFQEADEYYKNIEKRIVEIKEMIVLRSKVGKVIKKSQGSLLGILGEVYPFASDPNEFEYPKTQTIYDVHRLFEEIKEKGEKRESEIMLTLLRDLMEDIQYDRIGKTEAHKVLKKIREEDITVVSVYYESKLIKLLVNNGDEEEIEKIIEVYRKIHKYFDYDRKDVEDTLVYIVLDYILGQGIDYIDMNIIKTFSKIVKGNPLNDSADFYNQLYLAFIDMDTRIISDGKFPIDLTKYKLFTDVIWLSKSSKKFMKSILAPIFVWKMKEDMMIPSYREVGNISMDLIKSKLSLPKCEFYERLFIRLTEEEDKNIFEEITRNIVDILIEQYKDSEFSVRISILSKYVGLWKDLDMDTKEKFVKEILDKTILEQVNKQIIDYLMKGLSKEDLLKSYEIYRNYMKVEYVNYYIDKVIQ